MKKLPLILVILVLTVAAFLYCVRNSIHDDYQIVTLAGGESYAKVSNLFMQVTNNSKGYSALPLFDHEMIDIKIGNEEVYYRFSKKDGSNLNFSLENFKLFLNSRLIGVIISEDPAILDWLNSLTPEETAGLRSVVITDSLSRKCLDGLKKLANLRKDLGLQFSSGKKPANAPEILEIFNPAWLAGIVELNKSGIERLYSLTDLEWLEIDNKSLDPAGLPKLGKLRDLIISKFEPPRDGSKLMLPKKIKNLTISQSDIFDLKFLGSATGLEEFNLVFCDSVSDISTLAGLTNLRRIGFTGSEIRSDLTEISQIQSISGFSFPGNLTYQDFARFIGAHKKLRTVEIFGCSNITDLEPLKDLPDLSCLCLAGDSISTEKLFDLKKLAYLSVQASLPADSTLMKELKGKLPNTIIVPSKGLCLGTGWLLLVIPLFFLIQAAVIFFRKRTRV